MITLLKSREHLLVHVPLRDLSLLGLLNLDLEQLNLLHLDGNPGLILLLLSPELLLQLIELLLLVLPVL